jgi:hypothetical protein
MVAGIRNLVGNTGLITVCALELKVPRTGGKQYHCAGKATSKRSASPLAKRFSGRQNWVAQSGAVVWAMLLQAAAYQERVGLSLRCARFGTSRPVYTGSVWIRGCLIIRR